MARRYKEGILPFRIVATDDPKLAIKMSALATKSFLFVLD